MKIYGKREKNVGAPIQTDGSIHHNTDYDIASSSFYFYWEKKKLNMKIPRSECQQLIRYKKH